MQEMQVQSLGGEDALKKEMANHSSKLAWEILCTEEPGRLQSMGSVINSGHFFIVCLFVFHLFFLFFYFF